MFNIFKLFVVMLPWSIKRFILIKFFKYQIHKSAKIGFSWIFPTYLEMKSNSKIGHFNTAIHLDKIVIGEFSTISRNNWITGFSTKSTSAHFAHQVDRQAQLIIGAHSSITKKHHIDCTSSITIGNFTTIAGYYSQLLTHSIDIVANRQDSHPITIGDFCFVGTNVVILGGGELPSYSVLGAKSLLNKQFTETYSLYGGVPAKKIMSVVKDAQYFVRKIGFVY